MITDPVADTADRATVAAGHTLLKAAVVGLGGMGRRHLQAMRGTAMRPVALCDLAVASHDPAVELCAERPRVYMQWQELLASEAPALDLLTVATTGPSHAEIVIAAAKAGVRYIMCEKPMATSGGAAREMAQVCASTGTRLAINLSRRYATRFTRLKALVRSGAIGVPAHVNVSVGAGGLGCIGTHYFDFIAWLADTAPAWLVGEIDRDPEPNVRGPQFYDPGGRGTIGYANGMTACFQLSERSARMPLIQVVGSDGYIDLEGWSPPAGGTIKVFARPAAAREAPKTRLVPLEPMTYEAGPALDVVAATRACLDDLLGAHRENTVAGGIAAVDTVIAFHLSGAAGWEKIALPLANGQLSRDVPFT